MKQNLNLMPHILRYKVRPSSGWIYTDPFPHEEAAVNEANKLVTKGECCKVEVYALLLTGVPVPPTIQIKWAKEDEN